MDKTLSRREQLARKFMSGLQERISLRLHKFVLLSSVALSGLLTSKLLQLLGIHWLPLRYGLVALLAYCYFIIFVRIWIAYILPDHLEKRRSDDSIEDSVEDVLEAVDSQKDVRDSAGPSLADTGEVVEAVLDNVSMPGATGSSSSSVDVRGGGGSYGGAGAASSWKAVDNNAGLSAPVASLQKGSSRSGLSLPDLEDVDFRAVFIFLVATVVIAVVFGVAIYLIFQAPIILTEIVFEFLLSLGLLRATRRMRDGNWVGSVLRATWIPFTIILFMAVGAGIALDQLCPGQSTMWQVIEACA